MRFKHVLLAGFLIILIAVTSSLIQASGDSVIVNNDNIVLKDASGNIQVTGVNATWLNGTYLFLGSLTTDPVTLSEGQMWYNSAEDCMKYYNGSIIQIIPSIGGGSINGTYTLVPAFTVFKSGSTYYAERYDGLIAYSSTNASYVINSALSALTAGRTWQETVVLKGLFTITASILVPSHTHLIIEGAIFTSSDSHISAIKNADTTGDCVLIEGGEIYCYSGSGYYAGIEWNPTVLHSGNEFHRKVQIRHITVDANDATSTTAAGANLTKGGTSIVCYYLDNVHILGRKYGLWMSAADCVVGGACWFGASGGAGFYAVYLYATTENLFTDFISDGPIFLDRSQGCTFSNFYIDCSNRDIDGFTLKASFLCALSNGQLIADSNSGYTRYAIKVTYDDATYNGANNVFSNIYIGRRAGMTSTQRWSYGIYEDSNVDYNLYTNINAKDAGTMGLKLVGTHSYAIMCWNQTTFIATATHG